MGEQAFEPNTLLLDNALASMGAGLPSAMAVALLYPEKKVVAVCGDGGFMMNSQVRCFVISGISCIMKKTSVHYLRMHSTFLFCQSFSLNALYPGHVYSLDVSFCP